MRAMSPIFITLITLSFSVDADVFKCKSHNGEMVYQSAPCPISEAPEGKLKIKEMTQQQKAAADAEIKAEDKEQTDYETAKAKAERQQQSELQQQEKLELEERRTRAQEEQADTERKRVLGGPGSPYWRPTDNDNPQ